MNLILPFPPSTNTYYRMVNNRMLISKKGREYRKEVYAYKMENDAKIKPLEGRLSVSIKLFMPDRRRRDLDNFGGKAILDAITHAGYWLDDSQIDSLWVERREVLPPGLALVGIEEV